VDYSERASPEGQTPAGADPDARYGVEYDRSPSLRAEFSGRDTYIAYAKAQAAGRVALSNKLTTGD